MVFGFDLILKNPKYKYFYLNRILMQLFKIALALLCFLLSIRSFLQLAYFSYYLPLLYEIYIESHSK